MPYSHLERVYGDEKTSAETIFLEEGGMASLVRHGAQIDSGDHSQIFSLGSASSISRHHAILVVRDGLWTIIDNSSTNGTRLNGAKMPANEPCILFPGDEVDFAKQQSRYRFIAPYPATFKKMALITGHYNDNKYSGVVNNAYALRRPLEKRGFRGGVKMLLNEFATPFNILSHLELVLPQTSEDSIFTFYFSGHANENAHLLLGNEALDAYSLFARLRDFRGKVLIILDGCYTESFSSANLPPNCSLIGNSGKGYETVHQRLVAGANHQDQIKNQVAGNLTMAIVEVLEGHPNGIHFSDLLKKVQLALGLRVDLKGIHPQNVFLLGENHRIDTEVVGVG